MKKCKGKKRDGSSCKADALAGQDCCFFHSDDPAIVAKRKRAQTRGGDNKAKKKAPKKRSKAKVAEKAHAEDEPLVIKEGATLDAKQLEALLATAIVRCANGEIAAPLAQATVKLAGIYEKVLSRQSDDIDAVRKLSKDELTTAMLNHIPTRILIEEMQRRRKLMEKKRERRDGTDSKGGEVGGGKADVELPVRQAEDGGDDNGGGARPG